MSNHRRAFCFSLLLLNFLLLVSCGDQGIGLDQREYLMSGKTMGTTYNVKIVASKSNIPRIDQEKIYQTIERLNEHVNAQMSTWQPDSTLSKFNDFKSTETFSLDTSPATDNVPSGATSMLHVLEMAQNISMLSDGAFDITVGPLVNLYGFGPDPKLESLPTNEQIDTLRPRIGYEKLHLNHDEQTLRKDNPQMYVDLSAIAKGYGVDLIAEHFDTLGIENYMVEIGGEVRTRGLNRDGKPWQIAIEKPSDGKRAIHRVLSLRDIAMATSGDYRNYYLAEDGSRISHTIDPRTDRPIQHNTASVTVLDPSCTRADALATAMMVLGPDAGLELANRAGLAVLFLVRSEDKTLQERPSAAFQTLTK